VQLVSDDELPICCLAEHDLLVDLIATPQKLLRTDDSTIQWRKPTGINWTLITPQMTIDIGALRQLRRLQRLPDLPLPPPPLDQKTNTRHVGKIIDHQGGGRGGSRRHARGAGCGVGRHAQELLQLAVYAPPSPSHHKSAAATEEGQGQQKQQHSSRNSSWRKQKQKQQQQTQGTPDADVKDSQGGSDVPRDRRRGVGDKGVGDWVGGRGRRGKARGRGHAEGEPVHAEST
jgi:hypothetical protein